MIKNEETHLQKSRIQRPQSKKKRRSLSPRGFENAYIKINNFHEKHPSNRKGIPDENRTKKNKRFFRMFSSNNQEEDIKDIAWIESKISSSTSRSNNRFLRNRRSKNKSYSPNLFKKLEIAKKIKAKNTRVKIRNSSMTDDYNNSFTPWDNSFLKMNERLSKSPNSWVKNLSQRLSVSRKEANNGIMSSLEFINNSKKSRKKSDIEGDAFQNNIIHLSTDNVIKKLKEGKIEIQNRVIKPIENKTKDELNEELNEMILNRKDENLQKMTKLLKQYTMLSNERPENFANFRDSIMKTVDPSLNTAFRNNSRSFGNPDHSKINFDTSNEKDKSKKTDNSLSIGSRKRVDFKKRSEVNFMKFEKNYKNENGYESSEKIAEKSLLLKADEPMQTLNLKKMKLKKEVLKEKKSKKKKRLFKSFDNQFGQCYFLEEQRLKKINGNMKKKENPQTEIFERHRRRRSTLKFHSPISRKFTKSKIKRNKSTIKKEKNFSVRDILKLKDLDNQSKAKLMKSGKRIFLKKLARDITSRNSLKSLNRDQVNLLKKLSIQVDLNKIGLRRKSKPNLNLKFSTNREKKLMSKKSLGFKFSGKNSLRIHTSRGSQKPKFDFPLLTQNSSSKMSKIMFRSYNEKLMEENKSLNDRLRLSNSSQRCQTPKEGKKGVKKNKKRGKIKSFDTQSGRLGSLKRKNEIQKCSTRKNLENEKKKSAGKNGLKNLFYRKKELIKQKKISTFINSRASISTTTQENLKFKRNTQNRLENEREFMALSQERKKNHTDDRIRKIIGSTLKKRKNKKKSKKKSKSRKKLEVPTIQINSKDLKLDQNVVASEKNRKKSDPFIYRQFTQPCEPVQLKDDIFLKRNLCFELNSERENLQTEQPKSQIKKLKPQSKKEQKNIKSPREFKKKHKNNLKKFTHKRKNKIKIHAGKTKPMNKKYISKPDIESRGAKTSKDPSTQATNDNMNFTSLNKAITSTALKEKYSSSPCEYYMKDLLFALKNGMKQQKAFRYYEHFLYNTKTQLIINKNKSILSNKHTKDLEFEAKKIYLPPLKRKGMKTLVLDLDETLIHCNADSKEVSDAKIPIKVKDNSMVEVGINFRPYVNEFLETLSKDFEIVIFTASHPCYANKVLDILDSNNQFISYRVFRDHCVHNESGVTLKDLRIFANRKIENILLVDNALYSYALQPYNGIPIVPFYDDKKDKELKKLAEFLKEMKDVDNIKSVIKTVFRVDLFKKFASRVDILSRKLLSLYKGNI